MKLNTIAFFAGLSWLLVPGASAQVVSPHAAGTPDTTVASICSRPAIECLRSDAGIVIGAPGTTATYANNIESAARTFERYFGVTPPKAAVLLGEVTSPDVRAALRDEYRVVLPWITVADRKNMIATHVRAQVRSQRSDIADNELEAIVARSVKASLAQGQGRDEDLHQGVFAHELGHLYFIRTFWPDEPLDVTEVDINDIDEYAGPGPDWLDEMGAVLMENAALITRRDRGLATIVQDSAFDTMWSMDDYFTMQHPVFRQAQDIIRARQQTAEGRAQGGVVILSGADAPTADDGKPAVNFYLQSRGFAAYMIEKSSNERIFADIAAFISGGGTMQQWLAANAPTYGIPQDLNALQADFERWLAARFA